MIEMVVESIRISLVTYQRVVILKEKDADRFLPIWIGGPEADAIAVKLQNVSVARPLTHDLLVNLVKTVGGTITHILINDLSDDVFFARIVLDLDGRHLEVDSRPSDAIALALRAGVPIYVEESVLERAAVGAEGAESATEAESKTPPPTPERIVPLREDELKGLSAFKDFIGSLDLDKLDKPGNA